jgi:hypothetical protein
MTTATRPRSAPVPVELTRRPEPQRELTEIEFVNMEETVLSANKCSCAASDDNPY